jgi:hypothetical protein
MKYDPPPKSKVDDVYDAYLKSRRRPNSAPAVPSNLFDDNDENQKKPNNMKAKKKFNFSN